MSNQDRAEGKDYRENFRLWFFRDLTDAERQKLYRVCGLPVQELGTHGSQRHALDIIWPTTPQAPGADTPGGRGAEEAMPPIQRWKMAKGSDAAQWSVYMDHDERGEWCKWSEVQQKWCLTHLPKPHPAESSGGDAVDAARFRWLMSEQADMVWAPYGPRKVRWTFYMEMPEPDISAENLTPWSVKAELISAIDEAIASGAEHGR